MGLKIDGYDVTRGDLSGGWLIRPHVHGDARGRLSEIYSDAAFEAAGLPRFLQDNQSWTPEAGVVRGLHFQKPPYAQTKLFRVLAGAVYNVAADLRPDGFGQVWSVRLAPEDGWALLPAGVAHGIQTLTPDVQVHYRLSTPFAPAALAAVRHDDPTLAIDWPLPVAGELSERDRTAPELGRWRGLFTNGGL